MSLATIVTWPDEPEIAAAPKADPTTLHKDATGWKTCALHDVRWADHNQPCWCCAAGIPPLERSAP